MYYNNLTLLTDLYELKMMQGYFLTGIYNNVVIFDLFYRNNPDGNGYAIVAGLEQVIEYINNISFNEEDIEYLKSLNKFDYKFLMFLKNFKFTGDIYAIPEGTVVFPKEPLLKVKAPIIQAQLIESTLLNIINHQSLIATKASRVCWAARGDDVLEFGLRRAQGPDAGIYGSRAAFIGGCSATSNVLCGKMFNVPVVGTHGHSWVMSFSSELEAFREYAKLFPNKCILLVDTYDTLKSGIPNAIKVFLEMKKKGIKLKLYGVRIDSGNIFYLSKKIRNILDREGFRDAIISASSDLDEYLINDLKAKGAKVSSWGVGTSLITSKTCPSFGAVYKLVSECNSNTKHIPKIKISENIEKITYPGEKKIFRIYEKDTKKIKADLITLEHEDIYEKKELEMFDSQKTRKKSKINIDKFIIREILEPIFIKGKCVYKIPNIMEIRKNCESNLNELYNEYRRLEDPDIMPVNLSNELYKLKNLMIDKIKNK